MALGFLIAISVALGVTAWLAFLWAVKSGQFDDPEGPKYRMLQDDDDSSARPSPPLDGTESVSGAAERKPLNPPSGGRD